MTNDSGRIAFKWQDPPAWITRQCRRPNGHQDCDPDEDCDCTCHTLDNDKIGWLKPEMEQRITDLADLVGDLGLRDEAWFCAATVLAVWECGTDPVRIGHAIGKGPKIIHRAACRLLRSGIWCEDGSWHARYVESDATDADLLELSLHVLVAEGEAVAVKQPDDTFLYQSTEAG